MLRCVWLSATLWTLCSPPGSSVHGILQARILEWVALPSSSGSSRPRDQTQVSWLQADSLLAEPPLVASVSWTLSHVVNIVDDKHSSSWSLCCNLIVSELLWRQFCQSWLAPLVWSQSGLNRPSGACPCKSMGESFSSGPEVALRGWRQALWPGAAAGALEEAALRRKPLSLGDGKLKDAAILTYEWSWSARGSPCWVAAASWLPSRVLPHLWSRKGLWSQLITSPLSGFVRCFHFFRCYKQWCYEYSFWLSLVDTQDILLE